MPKLYIENGADRGHSYLISKDGPFFAGRDSAAQVPIRDEMCSRRQFQIEVHSKIHHLRDLGSRNGTYLNGKRVQKIEALSPNDRIQVGETIISFLADEPHPLLGQEIGGYKILDRVGRGGMGTVYRAVQLSLDRNVALKILAPHLVKNANFINLFIREARAAGGLSHPNIVQVYDVGVHDEVYFFSMEFIPHGSVEDILNDKEKLSLSHALRVVRDAALGLEYAEQKGFIHRDIKPGNLMVGTGGIVKIGDLGIARSTGGEDRVSQKDGVSGSPHYIAPEQARGHDIDHRVDIYALGVSFYQMLCGKTPHTGTTPREVVLKQIKEEPQPIEERVTDLPSDVADLVKRMMAKDPQARTASATLLLEKLTPLIDRYDDQLTTHASRVSSVSWRHYLIGAALLLSLAAATAGAIAAFSYYRKESDLAAQNRSVRSETLDNVEASITTSELIKARTLLEELDLKQLDDDQRIRFDALSEKLTLAEQRAAQVEYEERAKLTLQLLQSELQTPRRKVDAERLRGFADEFDGTEAAEIARTLSILIVERLDASATLEAEGRQSFDRISDLARQHLPNYAQVRRELFKFDVTKFASTAAYRDWEEEVLTLKGQVRNDWHDFSRSIATDRQRNRSVPGMIVEVELFMNRLGEFDDFKDTRLEAAALLADLRKEL